MATANNYGDCVQDVLGSGQLSCDKTQWGDLKGMVLVSKGTTWAMANNEVTLTQTDWENKIKSATLFPYQKPYDYDSVGNENDINTSSIQIEKTVRQGLPKIQYMFTDGNSRHESIYDKKGFGRWDLILLYTNGMRLAQNTTGTAAKGFDGGNFNVETETIQKGTDLQMTNCSMQLTDADEFNGRNVFLTWTDLGFDALEIKGFNDVTMIVDPISAGGTFSVSIVSKYNAGFPILDLDTDDEFVLLGTQASSTTISGVVYNATTSKYDFTVSPDLVGTDTVQVKTSDGTYDVIEDSLGNKFKGTSNTVTVS